MAIRCLKRRERKSLVQWDLDAKVCVDGGNPFPCYFSITPGYLTLLAPTTNDGEKMASELEEAFGAPDGPPDYAKGGPCDGDDPDENEFAFSGSMLSVSWTFARENRVDMIHTVRVTLGPCEEE